MVNIEDEVVNKFQSLNNSQTSIQNTSAWVISNKNKAKEIVKIWYKEFRKANSKKKLTFLYLANDIIQNGRKKAPYFADLYQTALPTAFKETSKSSDTKTKESLLRLVKIWKDRSIYKKDFLEKIRLNITKYMDKTESKTIIEPVEPNEVTQHSSTRDPRIKSKSHHSTDNSESTTKSIAKPSNKKNVDIKEDIIQASTKEPVITVKSCDLLAILEAVQNPPSIDEVTRRTIASFPPEVSDPHVVNRIKYRQEALTTLEKVNNADTMLIDYNSKLTSEMQTRKELASLLKGWLSNQPDAIKCIRNKLILYQGKLESAKLSREILKSHLSNLPELELATETDNDLNPLPSLDELFN